MPINTMPLNIKRLLWILFYLCALIRIWLIYTEKTLLIEWQIIFLTSAPITFPLVLDTAGMLFARAVILISANVIRFANTYILGEQHIKRFTILVMLFVTSIIMLIIIPHLISLLIGWDGLGIVSFLLVIYYQNPKSLGAGIITALTNRIGDVLLLLSIALISSQGHWIILSCWETPHQITIIMFLMLAATTKRAQLPFSSWLPAAIAAPTPVSALVHSSTLVTAGVFLIIRFYPYLHLRKTFHFYLAVTAIITITIASINALAETDIKKIIALSTLRQLGVIIASLAINIPNLAFFHLITHALFKALLFITAGTLIHLHLHSQDLRRIGNLSAQIPLTTAALTCANIALCGLPFIAGFYSKDLILEITIFSTNRAPLIILFVLGAAFTAAYSIRITITIIWAPNLNTPIHQVSDNDTHTTTPIISLALGAIASGSALNWIIFSPTSEPFLPYYLKLSPLSFTLLGAILAAIIALSPTALWKPLRLRHHINALIWFIAPLSTQQILLPNYKIAHISLKTLDHGWHEALGPQGLSTLINKLRVTSTKQQKTFTTTHLTLALLLLLIAFITCPNSLK